MADFKGRAGGPKRFNGGGKPSFGGNGGKPGFQKKNWADRGDSRSDDRTTTLHKAICSKCGNECEVPFRPVNGKPVFCRNCFVKTGDTDTRGRAGDRFQSNDRFSKRDFGPAATTRAEFPKTDNGPVLKQLEILSSKLDRLVTAIESMRAIKNDAVAAHDETVAPMEEVEKSVKTPKAKKPSKAKTK